MTEPTIRRAKRDKEHPYFQMRRATAQDHALTPEALGVLTEILSRPDDWSVNVSQLTKREGLGRDKAYRILNELIGLGYVQRLTHRDEQGRVSSTEYVVYEEPQQVEHPLPENPYPVKPVPANTDYTDKRKALKRDYTSSLSRDEQNTAEGVEIVAKPSKPTFDDLFGAHTRPTELPLSVRLHTAIRTAFYQDRKVTQSEEFLITQAVKDLVSVEFKPEDVQGFYDWLMGKGFTSLTPRAMGNHVNTYLGEIQAPKARRTFTIEGE